MGGLAPELGGVYFVQGPPVLGFVHCVRLQKNIFRALELMFFAIATKVPLRQHVKLLAKNKENRGDSCPESGQTRPCSHFEPSWCLKKIEASQS